MSFPCNAVVTASASRRIASAAAWSSSAGGGQYLGQASDQGAAACFREDTEDMNRERTETYLRQLAEAALRRARTLHAALFRQRQDTRQARTGGTGAAGRGRCRRWHSRSDPGRPRACRRCPPARPGKPGQPGSARAVTGRADAAGPADAPPSSPDHARGAARLRPQHGTHPTGLATSIAAGRCATSRTTAPPSGAPPRLMRSNATTAARRTS